jgi:hypothetical protein
MHTNQCQTRPRTDFSYVSTPSLISSLASTGDRPNIRLMEQLLSRLPEWAPALAGIMHSSVARYSSDEEPAFNPVWLAVVAGVARLPEAVPPLIRLLRAAPEHDDIVLLAGAEALAKIGAVAVEGVTEVAGNGEWWQRIWAYASLGWNPDPRAGEILRAALAEEVRLADGVSLVDVIASALADRGDADDIPALLDALQTCDPDLRGDIEDTIRDLHGGGRDRLIDRDWRLRYRMDPDYGFIDAGWPASAVGFTEDDGRRPRLAPATLPVRTLEAILAHPEPVFGVRVDADGNPLCQCCEARMWLSTGVWVCPATAMKVCWIQDRWLTRARDEMNLDDLFDVFDLLEDEHDALLDGPRPATPWDQDEVDPLTAVGWAWRGVEWLIEKGIDDVWIGGDRIRGEATKLVGLEALTKQARDSAGEPSIN